MESGIFSRVCNIKIQEINNLCLRAQIEILTENTKLLPSARTLEYAKVLPTFTKFKNVIILLEMHSNIARPTGHLIINNPKRSCIIIPESTVLQFI